MKTQKDNNVFKEALLSAKKFKKGFSMSLFWFAFLTILSLSLAYVRIGSLIITIPFVIIPSYFAFIAMNSVPNIPNGETGGFFLMYRTYFSQLFHGCFKVLFGFLKSFLAFFLTSVISGTIIESRIFAGDAEFMSKIENLVVDNNIVETVEALQAYMFSNEKYVLWSYLSMTFALLVALIVFVFHIFKNTPKLDFNFYRKQPVPMKQFSVVDREVRHKNKKEFGLRLFKGTWFIYIFIIIGFILGSVVDIFLLHELDVLHTFVLGLAISFVLVLPLFNYLSQVFHVVFSPLKHLYGETFVKITLELLNKYKEKMGIEADQAKKIEEILEAEKESIKKSKTKEKTKTKDKK